VLARAGLLGSRRKTRSLRKRLEQRVGDLDVIGRKKIDKLLDGSIELLGVSIRLRRLWSRSWRGYGGLYLLGSCIHIDFRGGNWSRSSNRCFFSF
jgi:hypothetical protein